MEPRKFEECPWLALPAVAELAQHKQWVVWRISDEAPERTKWPLIARGEAQRNAKSDDPKTWESFENAYQMVVGGKASGLGYVFSPDHTLVGMDFDHCFAEDGVTLRPAVARISEMAGSYTELSPSGDGVHIVGRWTGDVRASRKGTIDPGDGGKPQACEIYFTERYFRFTSDHLEGTPESLENVDAALNYLFELIPRDPKSVEGEWDGGTLVLDPRAEPPGSKLTTLCSADRKFNKTWKFDRDDFDRDLSRYDQSLASLTYQVGWSFQEIANTIIAFRRENGDERALRKALRLDYIQRTLLRAKIGVAQGAPEDALTANAAAREVAAAPASESVELLGVYIGHAMLQLEQRGRDPGVFYALMACADGESRWVRLGSAEEIQSQPKLRARILEKTGHYLPEMKAAAFKKIPPLIAKVATFVDVGEGDRHEQTRSWVDLYRSESCALCTSMREVGKSCYIDGRPILYRGQFWLRLERLAAFLGLSGERVSATELAFRLREIGFADRRLAYTDPTTDATGVVRAWSIHHEEARVESEPDAPDDPDDSNIRTPITPPKSLQ